MTNTTGGVEAVELGLVEGVAAGRCVVLGTAERVSSACMVACNIVRGVRRTTVGSLLP